MAPSIKRLVIDTPLEPAARRVWHWLRTLRPRELSPAEQKALAYDRLTIEVAKRVLAPTSNCIDVGAHEGTILRQLVGLAPAGTHYAFEPLPYYAKRLRKAFPQVRVMERALSDEPGQSKFRYVLSAPQCSGFERRPYDTYEEWVKTISVRVDRLDDLIPAEFPVRFIKVDVEGAECKVFRGARKLLSAKRPFVAFELGHDPESVFEELAGQAGLRISLLHDWLGGRPCLDRERFMDQVRGGSYFFLAHPQTATAPSNEHE
ncbi:MAG: FkbM family methyltransferase [Acidobacteria bacterium]|nr:FkbM family methyltransferase [Acidobacteriota bacterium]